MIENKSSFDFPPEKIFECPYNLIIQIMQPKTNVRFSNSQL